MQTIKQSILTIIICLAMVAGVSVVSAWTGPTQSAPNGNTPEPINVSDTSQYKTGALGVGGIFHGYSNAYFDGNVDVVGSVKGTTICVGSDCRTSWPSGEGGAETDPTVAASVKDGISWGEVSGVPVGFSDSVDNTGPDYAWYTQRSGNCSYIYPTFTEPDACATGWSSYEVITSTEWCENGATRLRICYKPR
jgi:hypothetical protein